MFLFLLSLVYLAGLGYLMLWNEIVPISPIENEGGGGFLWLKFDRHILFLFQINSVDIFIAKMQVFLKKQQVYNCIFGTALGDKLAAT